MKILLSTRDSGDISKFINYAKFKELQKDPKLYNKVLYSLAIDDNIHIVAQLFEAPKLPDDIYDILYSRYCSIRACNIIVRLVASDIYTPAYILSDLANTGSRETKSLVAGNKSTPIESLEILAKNEHYDIRKRVVNNPSTSTDILQYMANNDPTESIANYAKSRLDHPSSYNNLRGYYGNSN